ncbi:hypothetical protein ACM43_01600 [Bradyrhizobium sp. CCBAU 45321]|uniref:hypothetical protein n=1 Tax=Bradyrhizobium yuanmingense TaxID=108015 RepID=UPI000562E770|nr:hypothetical protein [Bradyrhizobium sp. CCBAU 45321]
MKMQWQVNGRLTNWFKRSRSAGPFHLTVVRLKLPKTNIAKNIMEHHSPFHVAQRQTPAGSRYGLALGLRPA